MRYTLGIDTSSSDTLAGVVIDGKTIASDINTSRLKHPAKTKVSEFQDLSHDHLGYIGLVVEQAVLDAGITYDQLDAVCVTRGPGLASALETGLNFAKGMALGINKPLIGIHHLEGHIYSPRLAQPFKDVEFPALVLVASGGATEYVLMRAYGQYDAIGGTVDDTAGETIEKIGKVLGFTYPAGPLMEQAAHVGNAAAYNFPRTVRGDEPQLSFNGLKLAVLSEITVASTGGSAAPKKPAAGAKRQLRADISINDVSASLQTAICELLTKRTVQIAQKSGVKEILVVGGVAANQQLRQMLTKQSQMPVRFPPIHLCANNGVMIAAAGYAYLEAGVQDSFDIEALTLWPLADVHNLSVKH
jgi:tRNA N6-adenosine threonylcarbamoyltransferase